MPIMIFMTSYYPDLKQYSRISAKAFLKFKFFPLFFLPFFFFVLSCTKQPTIIGTNLLPGTDFVNIKSTDTIVPRTYTMYDDSIISSKQSFSYIGGLYDAYFGDTYCDFVAQLRLTQRWPTGDVPTVDSVKLYFSVSRALGDRSFQPAIKLYEITELLSADSIYFSKRNPRLGMYIGSFPLGTVVKDTVTQFSVTLPNSFGEYLLRDTSKLNQESTADDFRSFFRGLDISIDEAQITTKKGLYPSIPELFIFDPVNGSFNIRVFYHTPTSETDLYFDFIINGNSVRYNRFFHDRSTADPSKRINHVNDNIMDTVTCVQSFYGLYGKIRLPGLDGYKSLMPLSINKARLVYTALLDGVDYTTSTVASTIYLSYTDTTGVKVVVPDYTLSATFFDGTFNTSAFTYSFNVADYVQQYLQGKIPKPELYMYLPETEYHNTILKSFGSAAPPKFTLIYTRF
jgi:Domain of unknown function (DUF4270)